MTVTMQSPKSVVQPGMGPKDYSRTFKVLVDCIYSSRQISKCSSAYKAKQFVERLLNDYPDTAFVTWLIPDFIFKPDSEALLVDADWLPKHPNIRYVPFPYAIDRMKAYRTVPDQLADLIRFDGECWDTDLIVTMRTGMVPSMRVLSTSPRQTGYEFLKRFLVYEEMPVASFKKTVAVSVPDVQDLMTVTGCMAADKVLITVDSEKQGLLATANTYFRATAVQSIAQKVVVANPAKDPHFDLKAPEFRYKAKGKKKFTIAYSGRTGSADRPDLCWDLMTHLYATEGDKVRCLITTVSEVVKVTPPSFVEVLHPPRPEFWRLLREEIDLVVCTWPESGFGLGIAECLFHGVPLLVFDSKFRTMIGDDYPFFVKSPAEALAYAHAFRADYDKEYAAFAQWQQTSLRARFATGVYARGYYDEMMGEVKEVSDLNHQFKVKTKGRALQMLSTEIANYAAGQDELHLWPTIKRLHADRVFTSSKFSKDPDGIGIVWAPVLNEVRHVLKAYYGWDDASAEPGHMKRRTTCLK